MKEVNDSVAAEENYSLKYFLESMLTFSANRFKNESVAELIKAGLEVYLHLPGSTSSLLFLLDETNFEFSFFTSVPSDSSYDYNSVFDFLLDRGVIASALNSGKIDIGSIRTEDDQEKNFIVIPLIDSNGVLGIVLVEFVTNDSALDQIMLGMINFHSFLFASVLRNAKLARELENIHGLLTQKVAQKTESIKKTKRELQLILDSINTGVWMIDKNSFEIIEANLAAIKVLGEDRKNIIGRKRASFCRSEDDIIKFTNNVNSDRNWESCLRSAEGTPIHIISKIKNIEFGESDFYLESFLDISEIKAAEEALIESESRFRTIFEHAGIGMILLNLEGKILESNSAFNIMLGYNDEEIKHISIYDLLDENDSEQERKIISDPIGSNGNGKFSRERKFYHKNGEVIWTRTTGTFLQDAGGNPVYGLRMIENITDRKKHEIALHKQTNLLNGVADATTVLLTSTDFDEGIKNALACLAKASEVDRIYIFQNQYNDEKSRLEMNYRYEWVRTGVESQLKNPKLQNVPYKPALERWYEYLTEDQSLYGSIKDFPESEKILLDGLDVMSLLIVAIKVEGNFWGFIGFDDCKSDRVWSEVEESILKATANAIGGAIQREISQKELVVAKEMAEKSDKLKSEFLAQVSHEIRSPINNILNYTSLIKYELDGEVSDSISHAVNVIHRSGERIIRTIDLILNMSDIQIGAYEYKPTRLSLYSNVLVDIYTEYSHTAKEKGLVFNIKEPDFDTSVSADHYTVNQIFANLVDNAIKFTEEGCIDISFAKRQDKILVVVKDSGVGISFDYLPRIFEPFSQEEQGYTRKFEGNGLGMALVKKYCDINNAEIEIISEKSKGSEIRIAFQSLLSQ